ncbi:MAG: ATP-binding protein [Cyclobacteriaceae bacterium]
MHKSLVFTLVIFLCQIGYSQLFAQSGDTLAIKTYGSDFKPVSNVQVVIDDVFRYTTNHQGEIIVKNWKKTSRPRKVRAWNKTMEIASWSWSENMIEIVMSPKTHQIFIGIVKDESKAPLKSALIELSISASNRKYQGLTNDNGMVRIPIPIQTQQKDISKIEIAGYELVDMNMLMTDSAIVSNIDTESLKNKLLARQNERVKEDLALKSNQTAGKAGLDSTVLPTRAFKMDSTLKAYDSLRRYNMAGQAVSRISDTTLLGDDLENLIENLRIEQETTRLRNEYLWSDLKTIEEKITKTKDIKPEERIALISSLNRFEKMLSDKDDYFKQKEDLLEIINKLKLSILEKDDQIKFVEELQEKNSALFRRRIISITLISTALFGLAMLFIYLARKYKSQKLALAEANEKIILINNSLEEKVANRTTQLRQVNEELDLFFYRSSHDLRRPLRTIIGLNNIANYTVTDPDSIDLFKKVSITADHMDKMLRKLMMISDINRKVKPEIIDLNEIFRKVENNYKKDLNEANIEFNLSIEQNIIFYSSQTVLEIIVENIIENAIQFASTKKDVNHYIKTEILLNNNNLIITIEDNGMGIHRDFLPKIFNMFFIGNETSKGNGLGLYITGKAVAKLNGKIQVESELNKLTRFSILIPPYRSKHDRNVFLNTLPKNKKTKLLESS